MHPFFILGSLFHATVLATIGFFVLFAADRSGGLVKTIGRALGAWLFILAALAIICAIVAPGIGIGPWGSGWMSSRHARMMGSYPSGWMQSGPVIVTPPPQAAPANVQVAPEKK
jgi:hypothetical protein